MKKKMFLFNGLEQKIMCIDSKSVHRIEWQGKKESTVSLSKLVNVNFWFKRHYCTTTWSLFFASIITAFWREVSWKSFSSFCFIKWLVLYFRPYCMSHTYTHKKLHHTGPMFDHCTFSYDVLLVIWSAYIVDAAKRKYLSEDELC